MASLIFGRVSGCLRTTTTTGILRRTSATARLFSSCCGGEPRFISPSPWLMLPAPSINSKDIKAAGEGVVMLDNFYSPAHNKVCRIGGGGLVAADEDNYEVVGSSHGYVALYKFDSNEVFLWNPVSRERVDLPPTHTLPVPEKHHLRYGERFATKVIVSDSDCNVVVMSYGPEKRLAFCRPGPTAEWTPIGDWYHVVEYDYQYGKKNIPRVYEDIAYSKEQNRLFCITRYACVERWDLDSPRIECCNDYDNDQEEVEEEEEEEEAPRFSKNYLVVEELSNQVFLVERIYIVKNHRFETDCFHVYRIVEEELEEEGGRRRRKRKVLRMPKVEGGSLGGLAMFVGINHSFALPAADYPELIPDSIYFTSSSFADDSREMGIFNYKNETISPCYYPFAPPNRRSSMSPAPFWFTPSPSTTTTIY